MCRLPQRRAASPIPPACSWAPAALRPRPPGRRAVRDQSTPGRTNPMRPVVRLTARVLQLRELAAGDSVGYNEPGGPRAPAVAMLGVGYADGSPRPLQPRRRSLTARLPLVGRVSMDLTTFDVTDHPGMQPGTGWNCSARTSPPTMWRRRRHQRLRGSDLARPPLPAGLPARVTPVAGFLAAIGRSVIAPLPGTGALTVFAGTGLSHSCGRPSTAGCSAAPCWRWAISACRWWR